MGKYGEYEFLILGIVATTKINVFLMMSMSL